MSPIFCVTKSCHQNWCSQYEFRRNGIQLGTRSTTIGQIVQVLMRPVFITKFSFYWTLWLVSVITNESNWNRNKCVVDSPNRGDCFSCPCSDRMPKIECSDKLSHLQDQCFKSKINFQKFLRSSIIKRCLIQGTVQNEQSLTTLWPKWTVHDFEGWRPADSKWTVLQLKTTQCGRRVGLHRAKTQHQPS